MKKLLALLFLALLWSSPARAVTCNPQNTSGCPTTWPGSQGSTTPTANAGTGYTINGVTTASIDTFWGVEYNHSVCPYAAPSGDAQSSCDISWVMPHEAPGNPNNYEIIWDWHGGGGSAGGTQVVQTPAVIQNAILIVQQYLGTPNAVGGKGIVLAIPNYRLTSQGGIAGTNTYPAQWQDAKCAAWHVLANSATFPGNKTLMGSYGTSWGAVMVRWQAATPDNLNTTSCDSSAPGAEPQWRAAEAWNPNSFMYPFGNSGWDNTAVTAFYWAMQANFNCTNESTCQTACAALTCDPQKNTVQANIAVYKNVQELDQFGAIDPLIVPNWGSGGTQGGHLYGLSAAYTALSPAIHPFMELLPNCIHVCDAGVLTGSQNDAIMFLLAQGQSVSGGMGGSGLGGM